MAHQKATVEVDGFQIQVYGLLLAMRDRNERDVRIIERSGLLPNVRFYSPILSDHDIKTGQPIRKKYFYDLFKKAKGREFLSQTRDWRERPRPEEES